MVSAFAARQRLVLGQVKVADKANEIVAIPKLLDLLAIEGAIVTLDAIGCQRAIAQQILDKKADYVLALKGNQGRNRRQDRAGNPLLHHLARVLASQLGPVIRSHWAIENSLHWVMDMIFRDDECRIRTNHAPANFTTIKHMAQNLIRKAPGKDSLRLRRKTAAWDDDFLASLLAA